MVLKVVKLLRTLEYVYQRFRCYQLFECRVLEMICWIPLALVL